MTDRRDLLNLYVELSYRKAARDPIWFMEQFCRIQSPPHGLVNVKVRPAQREFIQLLLTEKQFCVVKARQIGWSTIVALFALWEAMFKPDQNVLVLSKRAKEATKLLRKVRIAYERLPEWLRVRAGGCQEVVTNQSLESIVFSNRSLIESFPGTPNAARGEAATRTYVDEAAYFRSPEETYRAVEPTVANGGQMCILSSANGAGTWFHELWLGAITGLNGFTGRFYGWQAHPDRDQKWYDRTSRTLTPQHMASEYPTTAEEAFVKSGVNLVSADIVMSWEVLEGKRFRIAALSVFEPDPLGDYVEFDTPVLGRRYVIGADVAEGIEGRDLSAAHVLCVDTGKVVAVYHGYIPPDLYGDPVLYSIGRRWGNALIGVEANSIGHSTLVRLRDSGYKRIYRDENRSETAQYGLGRLGWWTGVEPRRIMLNELAAVVRDGWLSTPHGGTHKELLGFVCKPNGRFEGHPHDDLVMSLALAVQMVPFAPRSHWGHGASQYPVGTLGWYEEHIPKPQQPKPNVMGAKVRA